MEDEQLNEYDEVWMHKDNKIIAWKNRHDQRPTMLIKTMDYTLQYHSKSDRSSEERRIQLEKRGFFFVFQYDPEHHLISGSSYVNA